MTPTLAPGGMAHPRKPSWPGPLLPALLLATVLHAALILALGFKAPLPPPGPGAGRALEVQVLGRPDPTSPAPVVAEALAPQAGDGTGGEDLGADSRPLTPDTEPDTLPASLATPPMAASPQASIPAPPAAIPLESMPPPPETTSPSPWEEDLLTAALLDPAPAEPLPITEPNPEPEADPAPALEPEPRAESLPPPLLAPPTERVPPQRTAAQILASRGQEIASLSARIEEEAVAYANRPRRKAISASTQEYKYASYLDAWRRKVEAIGNLNYPEEAKRRQLYGSLILRVALRADGSLEEVRVLRSSGSDILDQAAVRIVHLAAPYAPFPPDIRKETDFLDITRTWQFLGNNQFGEKK